MLLNLNVQNRRRFLSPFQDILVGDLPSGTTGPSLLSTEGDATSYVYADIVDSDLPASVYLTRHGQIAGSLPDGTYRIRLEVYVDGSLNFRLHTLTVGSGMSTLVLPPICNNTTQNLVEKQVDLAFYSLASRELVLETFVVTQTDGSAVLDAPLAPSTTYRVHMFSEDNEIGAYNLTTEA